MINVAKTLADLEASPGDAIGMSKVQIRELLGEVAIGQRARRALTNLHSMTAAAAITAGARP